MASTETASTCRPNGSAREPDMTDPRFKGAQRLASLLASAALALGAIAPAPASAQQASAMPAVAQTLVVCKDKSVAFRLAYPVGEIVVAQPDVLQLVATTDQTFYVRGKSVGTTNLLVFDRQHHLMQVIDVRVGYDTESLQADLTTALPNEHIHAANFAGGILLSGEATTLNAAVRAQEIAEHYAPKAVSSQVSIRTAEQVMVEVRIIEARRDALKDIGVNINAHNDSHFNLMTGSGIIDNLPPQGTLTIGGTIHGATVEATLTALEQKGVVRTLAKPNLIAMSGEEASFLAGGEFPYPVPNGPQQVTIEFKPFGVTLHVTPFVEPDGQIKLKIAPEVSALDPTNHLQIDGFVLPALSERKAATTVELRDGQSFAIAGLFQQDFNSAISQVPWASDVPVLGALFRSTSWKRNESELVIIVTPHLTAPSDRLEDLPNPVASPVEPDPIAQILIGRALDQPLQRPVAMNTRK
jgi:pilus assembly protein CpaC